MNQEIDGRYTTYFTEGLHKGKIKEFMPKRETEHCFFEYRVSSFIKNPTDQALDKEEEEEFSMDIFVQIFAFTDLYNIIVTSHNPREGGKYDPLFETISKCVFQHFGTILTFETNRDVPKTGKQQQEQQDIEFLGVNLSTFTSSSSSSSSSSRATAPLIVTLFDEDDSPPRTPPRNKRKAITRSPFVFPKEEETTHEKRGKFEW